MPSLPRVLGGLAALVGLGLVLAPEDQTRAVLLGVGTGALVAAIALAIVLTYRGSGVVNFATAAVATYAAYTYDALRRTGELFLPPLPNPLALVEGAAHAVGSEGVRLPDWPTMITVADPLAFGPALAITLAMSAILGLACHLLIFRPLRHAPPLAKIVASVGALITLQAIVVLRFGGTPRAVQPVLDKQPVDVGRNVTIPQDQLVLAAIVILTAALLWALFRFTRFGLATRAAAENEKGALLLGFRTDVLSGANWVMSTMLAALMGVLVATVNGSIDPVTVTLLIVPALSAALLGSFSSFGIATAAGFAIAMGQNLIQFWSTKDWFPHAGNGAMPGLDDALPFVVIVVALFLRGDRLPTRGALVTTRLPRAPRPEHVLRNGSAATIVCALALFTLGPAWRLGIINTLVGIALCLSLVILTGFVGQISLAQMAFAGIAGFTLSKLAEEHGVPFPIAPLLAAFAAVAVGCVAAVPALRIRGVNLAIATFAAAVAVESVVFEHPTWGGGLDGAPVPSPSIAGVKFGPNDTGGFDDTLPNPWFGVFCLAVVILLVVFVVRLRTSSLGQRMLAVRANERAAAAAGINVARTKLVGFALSAFVAGIGGALSGYRFGSVSPLFFGSMASLTLLAFAYLGGITTIGGAVAGGMLVAGGVAFTAADEWFGIGADYTLLVAGVGLILTAVCNPEGIAGAWSRLTGVRIRRPALGLPRVRTRAVAVESR